MKFIYFGSQFYYNYYSLLSQSKHQSYGIKIFRVFSQSIFTSISCKNDDIKNVNDIPDLFRLTGHKSVQCVHRHREDDCAVVFRCNAVQCLQIS